MNQLNFIICFIFTTLIAGVHDARWFSGCKHLNESCEINIYCCYGTCNLINGVNICTCKPNKSPCSASHECCTETCKKGKCVCKGWGLGCGGPHQCCNGVCGSDGRKLQYAEGMCACKARKADCKENSECCTGNCCNGLCACGPDSKGFACEKTPDCCGNRTCKKFTKEKKWGHCMD